MSYYFLCKLIFLLRQYKKNPLKELNFLKIEKNYFKKEKSTELIVIFSDKLNLFIVNFFVKLLVFYEKQNQMLMINKLHMYQNYYMLSQSSIISSLKNI